MKIRNLINEFKEIKDQDYSKEVAKGCSELSGTLEQVSDFLHTAAKIANVGSKILKKPETVVAINNYAKAYIKAVTDLYVDVLEANEELIEDTIFEVNETQDKVKQAKDRLDRMKKQAYVNSQLKEDENEGCEFTESELAERIVELEEEYELYYAS